MPTVSFGTKAKLRKICGLIAFLEFKHSTKYEKRLNNLLEAINDNSPIRQALFDVIEAP